MKKLLLFVLCALSLSALQAQVKVGIKGGASLTNFVGDNGKAAKAKFGYNAGVIAKIPIIPNLYIQPEGVYSREGAKSAADGEDITYNLDYINVPVLINYTTRGGFFAETGPQFGFLMSAKAKQGSQKEDIKNDVKKSSFSWAVGIGYMSKSNVGINARYIQGISNLQEDASVKTHSCAYQVGLIFLL